MLAESCCAAPGTLGELLVGSRRACASAARRRFVVSFLYLCYDSITHLIFVEYIAGATALDFRGRKKFEQLEKMMKRIPRITRALQEGLAEFEAAGVRVFSFMFSFL